MWTENADLLMSKGYVTLNVPKMKTEIHICLFTPQVLFISDIRGQGLFFRPASWTVGFSLRFKNSGHVIIFLWLCGLQNTDHVMPFWLFAPKWHHVISVLQTAAPQKYYHVTRIFERQTKTNSL